MRHNALKRAVQRDVLRKGGSATAKAEAKGADEDTLRPQLCVVRLSHHARFTAWLPGKTDGAGQPVKGDAADDIVVNVSMRVIAEIAANALPHILCCAPTEGVWPPPSPRWMAGASAAFFSS